LLIVDASIEMTFLSTTENKKLKLKVDTKATKMFDLHFTFPRVF